MKSKEIQTIEIRYLFRDSDCTFPAQWYGKDVNGNPIYVRWKYWLTIYMGKKGGGIDSAIAPDSTAIYNRCSGNAYSQDYKILRKLSKKRTKPFQQYKLILPYKERLRLKFRKYEEEKRRNCIISASISKVEQTIKRSYKRQIRQFKFCPYCGSKEIENWGTEVFCNKCEMGVA